MDSNWITWTDRRSRHQQLEPKVFLKVKDQEREDGFNADSAVAVIDVVVVAVVVVAAAVVVVAAAAA